MSEYNIQMNRYNARNVGYDQLYPATKIENVDGLDTALQNKAAKTHASQHASGGSDPITPANIGAAKASHSHNAGDIVSGILAIARGGTGVSSLEELAAALGISGTKIETGSYTGNGKTLPEKYQNSITFSFSPSIIIVAGGSYNASASNTYGFAIITNVGNSSAVCTILGYEYSHSQSCWITKADVTFSGNTVSWGVNNRQGVKFILGTSITTASTDTSYPQYQLNISGATYNWIAIE